MAARHLLGQKELCGKGVEEARCPKALDKESTPLKRLTLVN
jgi:hypothetical protein